MRAFLFCGLLVAALVMSADTALASGFGSRSVIINRGGFGGGCNRGFGGGRQVIINRGFNRGGFGGFNRFNSRQVIINRGGFGGFGRGFSAFSGNRGFSFGF